MVRRSEFIESLLRAYICVYIFKESSSMNIFPSLDVEIPMNSLEDTLDDAIKDIQKHFQPTEENENIQMESQLCECGEESSPFSSRIVGGSEVDEPAKYPWMVAIGRTSGLMKFSPFCGGVLISKQYILTAAHCMEGEVRRNLRVLLGSNEISILKPTVKVANFLVHPHYDGETMDSDIALLKLRKPVEFSDYVRPICLPTRKDFPLPESVISAGWGLTKSGAWSHVRGRVFKLIKFLFNIGNAKTSKKLNEVELPMFSIEDCKTEYEDKMNLTDNMICAGGTFKDTCQGDSGGPIFAEYEDRWYSVGVVSFGIGCGLKEFSGIYTRVANYLDWIYSYTKAAPPCKPDHYY